MNTSARLVCLSILWIGLGASALLAAEISDHQPGLFATTKLIYADTFDGPINTDFGEGL